MSLYMQLSFLNYKSAVIQQIELRLQNRRRKDDGVMRMISLLL